jgi:hypothetical protein
MMTQDFDDKDKDVPDEALLELSLARTTPLPADNHNMTPSRPSTNISVIPTDDAHESAISDLHDAPPTRNPYKKTKINKQIPISNPHNNSNVINLTADHNEEDVRTQSSNNDNNTINTQNTNDTPTTTNLPAGGQAPKSVGSTRTCNLIELRSMTVRSE